MKRVKIGRHLRAVERGAGIEIMDRDRPIARLVPVAARRGAVLQPAKVSIASLRKRRHTPAGWPRSSLDLLLEVREQHPDLVVATHDRELALGARSVGLRVLGGGNGLLSGLADPCALTSPAA